MPWCYFQSRSDFISGCAGVCPPVSVIQECLGLAVLDLWRTAKEKNQSVKEVCRTISYKSCLPETHRQEIQHMTRLARYQIRRNLKRFLKKLGRCSVGEQSLKLKYLMELSAVEPNYSSETFITSSFTMRVSGDGGIQTRSSDDQDWQTFCDFPQIAEINMKRVCPEQLPAEGRVVTLTRQDDRRLEVEFETMAMALSFVSLVDNYFRLTTDSSHYFCSEVAPPSLLQDIDSHCHGPITSEFAVHKLKRTGAKNGTFLLRRSPKEFDKFFLMNEKFQLAGIHSSFDSLRQLTDFYKRNTLLLSDSPVTLGSCCPPQAKELSNLIIIRNSSVREMPSSPTQHRHRANHIQFHMIKHEDLIWKESLGQGSFTHIYRGCKVDQRDGETHTTDVLLKVLDVEHKSSWESFFEAASFMSQISHKHLLLVYGVSVHKSKNIMVQEFVKFGALDLYLKRLSVSLSWKLDVAKQLACTLNFLCDKWSFGTTLWEIFNGGEIPLRQLDPEQLSLQRIGGDVQGSMMAVYLLNILRENWRLPAPVMCPPKVYSMMMQCWAFSGEDRPSFIHLQDLIESSIQDEREGAKEWEAAPEKQKSCRAIPQSDAERNSLTFVL
ncbi:Tyrosine-protein kinase JAK2 [Bagarius yarrelli]|uniref:Tyrosine-protein kinase JAK2 n=1 Tax=Bagarius yarrelli TaxID=175774 RepID=A0A556VWA6_BAGYA|nr:Tyrosine-protein kinase JAK2 [Bagarius yarrelli]